MARDLVYPLLTKSLSHIGEKASLLQVLHTTQVALPPTYVCVWDAFERYQAGDSTVFDQLRAELAHKLNGAQQYAVRSSANLEDRHQFSFAGQFLTVLDAFGIDALITAIQSVWDSVNTDSARTYLQIAGFQRDQLKMAVILQEMVAPVISGVVFSKNPLTGLDEIIVEAVHGSGQDLVQGSVKPFRWVYKWGQWTHLPENANIPIELIEQTVAQTQFIERRYGQPIDLEWVYDGQQVYWVQMRPITALDDLTFYSNRIAKEVLPGLIKPLVWSVNIPLVNHAWVRLLTELIGPNDIDPESLARSFYGRAYFNMGVLGDIFELLGFPRVTLELMLGLEDPGPNRPGFKPTRRTLRHVPRMLRFMLDKWRFARKFEAAWPFLQTSFDGYPLNDLDQHSEQDLLDTIDELFQLTRHVAYYNIVIPLLMMLYNQLLNRRLGRLGVDPPQFDVVKDSDAVKQLDPNTHLHQLHQLYRQLSPDIQTQILEDDYPTFCTRTDCQAFQSGVVDFLDRFGHLSDSGNDFSSNPWREQPELVLKMIAQIEEATDRSSEKMSVDDLSIRWWRHSMFNLVYQRARQFRLYREQISALYTYGYGLFRNYFLAIGARFVQRGVISEQEDVFFLEWDEIRTVVTLGNSADNYMAQVIERKTDLETARNLTPPETIFGDTPVPLDLETRERLNGVPTSRGYYRGKARVVRGIQDFDELQAGEVLVIPYSDVGWMPLFARAGAVISESGGMLSHSSIVAREYNIPAVVSVPQACQLLDGSDVSVDGFKGEILVHEDQS